MIFVCAALAVLAFLIAFYATGLVAKARAVVSISRDALAVIQDKSLSDAQKEKATQKAALSMLKAAFLIAVAVALILLASAAPVYLLDRIGLVEAEDVFTFLLRIDVIIITSLLVIAILWTWSKRPKYESDYSATDKLLHRIAFSAPVLQNVLTDMEDTRYAAEIDAIEDGPPIFVTSLARAGTTVVLNALSELPGTATHTYRDMPFVMAPLLWSRFSSGFQKGGEEKERAHGDGLKIGIDSPEAFEEVIWKKFAPGKFRRETLALWTPEDRSKDLSAFMKRHFRKILVARGVKKGRYLSKNNGNIGKLDLLPDMFPGASLIVPIRDPGEHAASLLRQHENFLKRHEDDPFSRRYMDDIGHYEFATLHRPFAFDDVDTALKKYRRHDPNYWLAYWVAFAKHVLARKSTLMIVSDRDLQSNPQETLTKLCRDIGIDPGDHDFSHHFRKITPKAKDDMFDGSLLAEARALYRKLLA